MSQYERVERYLRWPSNVSHRLEQIRVAIVGAQEQLQAQLAELGATVEASAKAQMESLRFLTRSIDELSLRLDKLERVDDETKG